MNTKVFFLVMLGLMAANQVVRADNETGLFDVAVAFVPPATDPLSTNWECPPGQLRKMMRIAKEVLGEIIPALQDASDWKFYAPDHTDITDEAVDPVDESLNVDGGVRNLCSNTCPEWWWCVTQNLYCASCACCGGCRRRNLLRIKERDLQATHNSIRDDVESRLALETDVNCVANSVIVSLRRVD